jgi:hypothetical protein
MHTQDARLQADLVAADAALAQTEAALTAGNQPGLVSAHDALARAMSRVDADIIAIAGT